MKITLLGRLAACSFILLCSPFAAAQDGRAAGPAVELLLNVGGEVERPLRVGAADWKKLPRRAVRAKDHDGKEAAFEGVPLIEILQAAGAKVGEDLRGKNLAAYLLVEAADGYRVVFALPELDPAFNDRPILLADLRDGKPLSAAEGPLRVIVPGEKRHARWVRQVIALSVRRP
ncbi:MAG: molybdopterin-dependent oxidoreductase [Pyrinomonadaceae bacterium]